MWDIFILNYMFHYVVYCGLPNFHGRILDDFFLLWKIHLVSAFDYNTLIFYRYKAEK